MSIRACFCAIVRPVFVFFIGLLCCGVRVGELVFVGTVVSLRGEGVAPEGRFFVRVGAIVCGFLNAESGFIELGLGIFALVVVGAWLRRASLESRLGVGAIWRSGLRLA